MTYYNVVRKLRPIAMWKGKEVTVELPKSEMDQASVSRCAVILQIEDGNGLPGAILGAPARPGETCATCAFRSTARSMTEQG